MYFHKISRIGLLLAVSAFLTAPMIAQQEVDPDHFDSTASKNQKPAPKPKAANSQSKNAASTAAKAKSKSQPVQVSAAQNDPAPVDEKH